MGAGASIPTSEEDAISMGYTPEQIAEYHSSLALKNSALDELFAKIDADNSGDSSPSAR